MAQHPQLQSKPPQHQTYRPIAPSIAPPTILPRPEAFNLKKREWDDTDQSGLIMGKIQRRGSGSSQGSNNSTSLAADQRKRRKEQNRAAQRAFRERKERYVKELEDKIKEIEAAHALQVSLLVKENSDLKSAMKSMQNELSKYKGSSSSSNSGSMPLPSSTSPPVAAAVAEGQSSPPYSDTRSPAISANSTPNTSPVATTPRVPSSAVACIRDKDGVSFCERLKEEVCSNAYDRLLTEPLFDAHGYLNETVASHPVPIVTSATKERSKTDVFNELEQFLTENFSPTTEAASNTSNSVDLISCSEVWQRIAKHPMFEQFNTDELCDELRRRAKCSRTGPVFEEYEVKEVLDLMVAKIKS
ncbi:hypothetical protein FB192DRAFT_1461176 [Mucor lusitanicus]|uniref:BZIP domain-containing protein n=2 Tax=Mucor circinelloides f. lusitanicus TaxID=29924 RepID=A0A8H4BCA5_MUCCL|nr:hypothetical protein FB192DRAFT_1461176 [Mucor lusitanicus]